MVQDKEKDALLNLRKQVIELINQRYKTVEEFCWDKGLSKATLSNFLNNKKDFQISTLRKIAEALGKSLNIHLK